MRADTRGKMQQVHAAICDLPSNGKTVTASVREIMKRTGQTRGCVARTIKLCAEAQWIEPTHNARNGAWWRAANSYRILTETSTKPSFLWSGQGIGPTAGLIYNAMPVGQWHSTIQIAQLAGVSSSTARKHLPHLMSASLLDHDEQGKYCRIDDDEYFTRTEERLTGQTRKAINRKVREEQIKWQETDNLINEAKRGLRKGSGGTQPGHNTSGRP